MQQIRGFRVVHVFDILQTEGEDLTDLDAVRPKLLDGSAPEGIWDALTGHAGSIGYEVIRHQRGSENGYCDFLKKEIPVRPDVSGAQAVKTLIHELGHALLHCCEPRGSGGRGRVGGVHRLRCARTRQRGIQLPVRDPLGRGLHGSAAGDGGAGDWLRQGDSFGFRRGTRRGS